MDVHRSFRGTACVVGLQAASVVMPMFKIGDPVVINTEGKAPRYDGVKGVVESRPFGHGRLEHLDHYDTGHVYWVRVHSDLRPYFYEHELSKGPW